MPVLSARDVAAALRDRLPGLAVTAEHKLLYYCQGHHLAATGEPLFSESIMAWNLGPVVAQLWKAERLGEVGEPRPITDEAALNTIGQVVSRYGRLRPTELIRLTHGEAPWRVANQNRRPGTSVRISVESIRDYFVSADEEADDEQPLPDADVVTEWLSRSRPGPDLTAPLETPDEILLLAQSSVGG